MGRLATTLVVCVLLASLGVPPAAQGQVVDAQEIHRRWLETMNRGDVDAALTLFTEDAVFDDGKACRFPFMCVGPAEIRPQVEALAKSLTRFRVISIRGFSANEIRWTTARIETRSEAIRAAGAERILQASTVVLRGARIVSLRIRGDEADEATAKFLAAQPRAPGRLPPPSAEPHGRSIDVGGRKIYLECLGAGSPTVVFEAGFDPVGGASGGTWDGKPGARPHRDILGAVARVTRACAYDRPGIGLSDAGRTPRTGTLAIEDLSTLLQQAGEQPPYVLVGFSLGGPLVYLFASRYSGQVAGLVYVDPGESLFGFNERVWQMLPQALAERERERTNRSYAFLASPRAFEGGWDFRSLAAQVRGSMRSAGLPDIPVVVLTAGLPDANPYDFDPGWTDELIEARQRLRLEVHADLARMVPRGRQILADSSEHLMFHFVPQRVTRAVLEVVEAVRRETRHVRGD